MTSLLILIYCFMGYNWIQRYLLMDGGSWTGFMCNFLLWPLFLLISVVSYLQVKPNNTIKEEL